ncbi:MAG: O-antigen ligase family protein [Nocardioides sp.]|nr:O-antigen ligase family protein [Nocardioides sp.]
MLIGTILSALAIDTSAASRTMLAVVTGIILILATQRIAAAEPRALDWLIGGWIGSLFVTTPIAIWELTTGQHLPNYYRATSSIASGLPAATFFNPNAYAIYLLAVQVALLWHYSQSRTTRGRVLTIAASALCGFLIVMTSSRLCVIGFCILILTYVLVSRARLSRVFLPVAVLSVLGWMYGPVVADAAIDLVPLDVQNASFQVLAQELQESDGSGARRVELNKTSVWLVWASGGIGVGPGNFGAAVLALDPPYNTGAILSPHSFIGELLSEFGILLFAGFLSYIAAAARVVFRSNSPTKPVLISAFLAYIPASFANSGYLTSSTMWALAATLVLLISKAELRTP